MKDHVLRAGQPAREWRQQGALSLRRARRTVIRVLVLGAFFWIAPLLVSGQQPPPRVEWSGDWTHNDERSESGLYHHFAWDNGLQRWTAVPMPAAQQQYGAEQEAEDSGEEWWFGHANYTEQGVVTGTVTAGYSSWPNCFWMGSGCTQTVEERIIADYVGNPNAWAPSAQEFERADHRKGETRATVARFDLKGHMLWYRHLLPGLAYNVTEDADGNILVVGHSYTNVWPDDLNLSDPDPSQNDNAVIRYNADGVTDMSTLDCWAPLITC